MSTIKIIAETQDYLVIDKPALVDSQNSKPGRPSVVDWLTQKYGFSGLVHRLDFGTSGLMVCAKTASSAKKLTEAMQKGQIDRGYIAIVLGRLESDEGQFDQALEEQSAKTHYKVLERFPNASLVEVDLETGRKHQIRRHFSDAGHPLLGEHLYKKKGSDRLFDRPALHAARLVVMGMEFESPLPDDLKNLINRLKAIRS